MTNDRRLSMPLDFSEAMKQGVLTPMERDVLFGMDTPAALEPEENDGLGVQNLDKVREFTKVSQDVINQRFAHLQNDEVVVCFELT